MIQVKDVRKSYQNGDIIEEVLKGISFIIDDGDFVAIVGPSGSGKSTMLNLISGLEKTDNGNILYDGIDITQYHEKELTKFRRDHVGFIFQQYFLLPNLTVEKNVKMGANLANNHHFKEVICKVGLEDKIHKYPSELSGGEQQRVSIARALAKKPKVLFLDEPTGALDEKTGRMILDVISKLKVEYGFTIFMVTHNLNIAEMANTVIFMNSGLIVNISKNKNPKNAYEIGW